MRRLAGRAVYVWHCDRQGRYSLYSPGVTNQNYLRGVQEADGGRPGVAHVDLPRLLPGTLAAHPLRGVSNAGRGNERREQGRDLTNRVAEAICDVVYATAGYEQSIINLSQVSLATDMVFSDSVNLELATVTGSVGAGLTASLTVAV